ncbi:hypothetical protein ABTN14_19480, partial [Acinetobacter baumannii]
APDWSVTNAALEQDEAAVAIIDRAGRLVCANARFAEWLGPGAAPPRLPLDPRDADRAEQGARAAWRDGRLHLPRVHRDGVAYALT